MISKVLLNTKLARIMKIKKYLYSKMSKKKLKTC